jgi:hypothetical protein
MGVSCWGCAVMGNEVELPGCGLDHCCSSRPRSRRSAATSLSRAARRGHRRGGTQA